MKKIGVYVVLAFLLSSTGYYGMAHGKEWGLDPVLLMLYLMWCPAAAGVITALIYREGLSGFGFGGSKWRWLGTGYFLPVVYAGLAYGIIWLFGFGGINQAYQFHPLRLVLFGTVLNVAFAAGEEIGWRGFLVPHLYKRMGFTATCLVTGLIWSLWHFPLIISGVYLAKMPMLPQLLLLVVSVTAMTFPISWLRLKSTSVWPAVLLHASHNLYIQRRFDPLTTETSAFTKYMIGESGIVLAAIFIGIAFLSVHFSRFLPARTGQNR